jgi:haloacetate dehalogenase
VSSAELFPGFARRRIRASGTEINLVMRGDGPPLLLLHGYPQTHAMWHRIAPRRRNISPSSAPISAGTATPANPRQPDHRTY